MLLRALLALALMLNGTALPPAAATGTPPNHATHAHQHVPNGLPDQAPAGDLAPGPATDCCDGKACDCGCTAPQAGPLRRAATSRAWTAVPVRPATVNAPYASSLISTPFRPPA